MIDRKATSEIRGLTNLIPPSQCACALDCGARGEDCGARVGDKWLLSTRTSAASYCALPLKGRLILAFLRAFRAGKTFVRQKFVGCDKSHRWKSTLRGRSLALAASRHRR